MYPTDCRWARRTKDAKKVKLIIKEEIIKSGILGESLTRA